MSPIIGRRRGRGGLGAASGAVPARATAGATDWGDVAASMAHATGVRPRRNELLSRYTTMRVGGPADLLAVARNSCDMSALIGFARLAGIPRLVIGRGSDLVVADEGVRGLVIVCRAEGWRLEGNVLVAEAGLPLAGAATIAHKAGLGGLEFGIAIPGTIGGAVWANAGAHGADVASILEWARVLKAAGNETIESPSSLDLAYRDSRLKRSPEDTVLEAAFALTWSDKASVKARTDEIRAWRRDNQPLGAASAGSVFRNPPGDSAGRLIDACGLKGARVGGAVISVRHANFIVNEGGATARDVRALAEIARADVGRKFGLQLEYEIQFIGDWPEGREEQ
jgi:UDP-N-acetylmuramate dehydrogenase